MSCDNNNHLTIHPGSRLWSFGLEVSKTGKAMSIITLGCPGREDVQIRITQETLIELIKDLVEANLVKAKTVFE